MPTYRITIYLKFGLYDRMEGERWHPSHDLEAVTRHFEQKAIEAIGQIKYGSIEVVMIDDDHGHTRQE
jgi:hypothetical protein